MKCRVTHREDGGVSITPIDRSMEKFEKIYINVALGFPNSTYEDMDMADLPVRDENRNKWRKKPGGGVMVDYSIVFPESKVLSLEKRILSLEKTNGRIP